MTTRPPALRLRPQAEIPAVTTLRATLQAEAFWPREILEEPQVRLRTTTAPLLFLNGPDQIRAALQEKLDRLPRSPLERRFASSGTGRDSIISGTSRRSPVHRQALSRLFKAQKLPNYFPFIRKTIRHAIAPWFEAAETGAAIDVGRASVHATFGAVWQIMFGEVGAPVPPPPVFDMADALFRAGVSGHLPTTSATISEVTRASLALRPERPLADDTPFSRFPSQDLKLTPEELEGNIRFLMVAGHESTALTIAWAMLMLGLHPEIRNDVAAEVRAEAGDGPIDLAALRRMARLDQVLSETMRLYPAAMAILREAACDMDLAGVQVPRGTQVGICFYALHRHRRWWDNPDEFRPDRFAPDQVRRRHPSAFLPFAAGPHSCLGSHLAWLEAMLVLATTLRELDFTLEDSGVQPLANYTLRQDRPVMMTFRHRAG